MGGFNKFQIDKIVDATISAGTVDHVVLVVSGDLSFSGKSPEYTVVKKCINNIVSGYKEKTHHLKYIQICCVPGNHDNSYPNDDAEKLTSEKLQQIRKTNSYEKHLESQVKQQTAFFNYAKNMANCDWQDDKQFHRRLLSFDGFRIEVNLINSGLFSTLDEDKGLHYISQHCINDLVQPTGADFVVTVMHHAPEWYTDDLKHQLENAIYRKSSIVFLGHEHHIEQKTISHEGMPSALIQAGGCLCNNDDWQNSSFFIGLFDTERYEYSQHEYVWNAIQSQYEDNHEKQWKLTRKPSIEKQLHIQDSFMQSFLHDPKHDHLTDDFRKYFVFPRLQQQNSEGIIEKEIISEDEFVKEVLVKKRVLIYGGYNLGKSTLLKKLFLVLSKDYVPVFCSISNIHGKNTERMIRNSFEDTYGTETSDYSRFQQMPKEKKVVIIDDADQISKDSFDPFLNYLLTTFEYVILASKQLFDLDLFERVKSIFEAEGVLYRYTIHPFYADKRKELIRKIVEIKAVDKSTIEKTTELLSNAIASQRRSIMLDPDFIINYAEYYCNNIGEVTNSDSSVFSKVFEANITTSLSPFCKGALSVNKVFTILGKIAHHIHFMKAYPVSHEAMISVVEKYNEEYGDTVSARSLIEIAWKSKIMIKEEQESGIISYRFSSRNYLAYFVAREINAEYNSTHDQSDLQKILRCACFGINADILLFISYITDNVQILNALLSMAYSLIEEWVEFDFDDTMPQYLKATTYKQIMPPQVGELEKQQKAIIENEKAEYRALRVANIYDYSDEAAEEIANQLIRACSLLIVIAKCLPGFEHNMKRKEKDAFVEMIYKMPNRIFGRWASLMEQVIPELVEFFQSQGQDYYQRTIPSSEDDILRALQNASLSLLLDLYNMASYYSTRDNTQAYLSSYNFSAKISYEIEHLMMLERSKRTGMFSDEALSLLDKCNTPVSMMAVAYIVRHALVFVPEFQPQQIDRLSQKFFSTKESKAKLMSQRYLQPGSAKKE